MLKKIICRKRQQTRRLREERSDDAIHAMLKSFNRLLRHSVPRRDGFVLLVIAFLILPKSSLAMFDPVEYMNYIQNFKTAFNSITQVEAQAQMLKSQLSEIHTNGMHLGQYHNQNIASKIGQFDSITAQGQSISYSMQNIDQNFKRAYPNYSQQSAANTTGGTTYQQAYQNWNNTSMNTFSNSLQAIGANTAEVQSEGQVMNQLESQSHSAQGRMQAMQVGNEMSAENVRQLESLKHLIAAQNNAQTAYMAQQVSKASYEQNSLHQITNNIDPHFPAYKNNPNFGEIKSGG